MSIHSRVLLLMIFQSLIGGGVKADIIHLKNGKSIEGIISSESKDKIVLDIGIGAATFSKSKIERIDRQGSEEKNEIKQKWHKDYFLSQKYVSSRMQEIADRFKGIVAARDNAMRAETQIADYADKRRMLQERQDNLESDLASEAKRLSGTSPGKDVRRYNELVSKCNALKAQITSVNNEIKGHAKRNRENVNRIISYTSALSEFNSYLSAKIKKWSVLSVTEKEKFFLKKISEKTRSYRKEFVTAKVESEVLGDSVIVSATINGDKRARLLVDTGASTVLLSSSFARHAGIKSAMRKKTEVILADGNTVKADPVNIVSLQVGEAKVENVDGIVVDADMAHGIDGLLGMSFLKHFVVQLDGGSGKLRLVDFDP